MSLRPNKKRLCPNCGDEFEAVANQISQCTGCGKLILFRDDAGVVEFEKGESPLSHHSELSATPSMLPPGGGPPYDSSPGPGLPPPDGETPYDGFSDHAFQASWFPRFFCFLRTFWHPRQVAIERFFINWWPAWLLSFTAAERRSLRLAVQGRFRITTLHDERVAKWLAATGEPVLLQGLTSLSPPIARQLAKSSNSLLLTGLLGFCESTAHCLSLHRGRTLYLDGLRSLPDRIAQILVRHRGRGLSLDGLTSVTIETAELLITYRGRLSLDGLRNITPQLAALLATHSGPSLSLNGITKLDEAVAEQLSTYAGDLYICGITELTGPHSSIFRDFPGKIVLRHHEIRPRRSSFIKGDENQSISQMMTLGTFAAIIVLALLAVLAAAMNAIGAKTILG